MHIQEARNIKGLYIQSSKQNNIIKNGKCEIKKVIQMFRYVSEKLQVTFYNRITYIKCYL